MKQSVQNLLKQSLIASHTLINVGDDTISMVLKDIANKLLAEKKNVLTANTEDLQKMDPSNPKYDRLQLTEERLSSMANCMKHVAILPSPVGKILSETKHQNGMLIRKISVPFGVIGIIYEARPNITCDIFSLCLKSRNTCILKGGFDSYNSNQSLVKIIHNILEKYNMDPNICTLLSPKREITKDLMNATGFVDLLIPRGSSSLIQFVRKNSRIPIIETGAGICHTYFDKDGDKEKGKFITTNAKIRRVSVCNALDGLIIHQDRLNDLPYICKDLATNDVTIYADKLSYQSLIYHYPSKLLKKATNESYGTEFLDFKMSIRTVNNISEAIYHITNYGSKHSECIISESVENIQIFFNKIDAACVYANVSTAFTDGAQFGMGAEVGISTQKLHARGPMSLTELTTYKYLVEGTGQIRS